MAENGKEFYVRYAADQFSGTPLRTYIESIAENSQGEKFLLLQDTVGGAYDTLATVFEDTLSGKLRLYHINGNFQDSVVIDFSLTAGDTFFYNDTQGQGYPVVVDSTYQMTDNNSVQRKVMIIKVDSYALCSSFQLKLIEGIGSEYGMRFPLPVCSASDIPIGVLKCVFDPGGNRVYGDTVSQCFVLSKEEYRLSDLAIYPNPVNAIFQWEHELPMSHMEIYNVAGQLVLSDSDPRHGDVSDLQAGLYLVILTDEDGQQFQSRVVKE